MSRVLKVADRAIQATGITWQGETKDDKISAWHIKSPQPTATEGTQRSVESVQGREEQGKAGQLNGREIRMGEQLHKGCRAWLTRGAAWSS